MSAFLRDRRGWLQFKAVQADDRTGAWDVHLVVDGTYTSTDPREREEMLRHFSEWLSGELGFRVSYVTPDGRVGFPTRERTQ